MYPQQFLEMGDKSDQRFCYRCIHSSSWKWVTSRIISVCQRFTTDVSIVVPGNGWQVVWIRSVCQRFCYRCIHSSSWKWVASRLDQKCLLEVYYRCIHSSSWKWVTSRIRSVCQRFCYRCIHSSSWKWVTSRIRSVCQRFTTDVSIVVPGNG